jgi:hypothetical protein
MTRAEFIKSNRQTSTVLVYAFGRTSFRITAKSKHRIVGNCVVYNGASTPLDGYTVALRP